MSRMHIEVPVVRAFPEDGTTPSVIEWTLAAAAELISPPKVDGENNEYKCEDIARSLRGPLRDKLMAAYREMEVL